MHTAHILVQHTSCQNSFSHMLVTKVIKEQMAAQQLHYTHTNMCQVHSQWYEQAKYDTVMWYADAKTPLLIFRR